MLRLFRRREEERLQEPTAGELEEQAYADRLETRAAAIEACTAEELRHLAALAIAEGERQPWVSWQERDYTKATALASLAVAKLLAGNPPPHTNEA